MRILYIDQYFSTRQGISGSRTYEFARLLVRRGHQVNILTSATQYAGDTGAQKRLIRRYDIEGISIWSLGIGYSNRMTDYQRTMAFLKYMLAGSVIGLLLKRADIVYATSTPLTVGIPGFLISWIRGGRFVFEVRDLWPEAPVRVGALTNPLLINGARLLERFFYRQADGLFALSPGMVDGICQTGIAPEKVTLAPNACDLDLIEAKPLTTSEMARLGLVDKFIVLYAGAIGRVNDLMYLVEMAKAVTELKQSRIHFLVVGDGSEKLSIQDRVKEAGLTNVTFHDPVPRNQIARYLRAAGATLTLFADIPILTTNSPNKFFDSLAVGRPTLVNSNGWTRELVEKAGAGFYLPPDEPRLAAKKLIELAADEKRIIKMGQAARRLAESDFNRVKLCDELEAKLNENIEQRSIQGAWGRAVKRLLDVVISLAALIVLSPFMLAISAAIRRDNSGSAFYRQPRAGRSGRIFRIFKYRTMIQDAEKAGLGFNVKKNDSRITRVGHFLREWSLDELPQLFNVLLGQMSLVGPRPPIPSQVMKYTDRQKRRLQVRPGLTGWAQVNGRNALTWSQKIEHDLWYVDHLSLPLDLTIIFKTFRVIFSREGLYEAEGGTDDAFNDFE